MRLLIVVAILGVLAPPSAAQDGDASKPPPQPEWPVPAGVDLQLNHLRKALHEGRAGELMQEQFPEGFVFTHTLYGLTLVNMALLHPDDAARRKKAVDELLWVLRRIDSEDATWQFPETQVRHGVFWLGQRNLLLGGLMMIQEKRDKALEREFHDNSGQLAEAFMKSPSANLDSYPGLCWPLDNSTALYSMLVHDHLYKTGHRKAVDKWVAFAKEHLDPKTGLMPSMLRQKTGETLDMPRGCSESWITAFLPEFDAAFGKEQYTAFRNQFFVTSMGMFGVREWPPGNDNPADVDSGPIVGGLGTVATGLAIAATRINGDDKAHRRLVALCEAVGIPKVEGDCKKYFGGSLPVGDAFLAWAKSIVPWTKFQPVARDAAPEPSREKKDVK